VTGRPEGAAHGARHLVGDVRRFGLLSAATVVDRYIDVVDRALGSGLAMASRPQLTGDVGTLTASAARMAEAYVELLDSTARMAAWRPGPGAERVVLPSAGPGTATLVSLWVHNPTAAAVTDLGLAATTLVSAGGASIPTAAVSFSPPRVDRVEAGASREVSVRVDVPPAQAPGQYHGLVLTTAAPDEPVGLSLQVRVGRVDAP
jgi:hypothetical protein